MAAIKWTALGLSIGLAVATAAKANSKAYLPDSVYSPGLEAAARSNDPRAQFELATAYFVGEGVAANDSRALTWARLALEGGQTQAACIIGALYVLQGNVHAVQYLTLGATAGYGRCQYSLALLLSDGAIELGVATDKALARQYFLLCAQQGRADCQLELANNLLDQAATSRDERGALVALANIWIHAASGNPANDKPETTQALKLRSWKLSAEFQDVRPATPGQLTGASTLHLPSRAKLVATVMKVVSRRSVESAWGSAGEVAQ
jgi:TPR repeat protein